MTADEDAVRRVDVAGTGIYVRVPVPAPGSRPQGPPPSRHVPPAALIAGGALGGLGILRAGTGPHGLLAGALLAVLTALAAVDLRARVVPNRIVGPAIAVALAWQLAFFPGRWAEWIVAGLGAAAFMLLPSLLRPGAVGMGDVKLAALLGVALGGDVATALLLGVIAGGVGAAVQLARGDRGGALPYAPFLALGAALVLLA